MVDAPSFFRTTNRVFVACPGARALLYSTFRSARATCPAELPAPEHTAHLPPSQHRHNLPSLSTPPFPQDGFASLGGSQGPSAPRSSRSRFSQRRKAAACEPPVDIDKLHIDCPAAAAGRCKSLVLENVCIVQETFIIYDPENADRNPDGLMKARLEGAGHLEYPLPPPHTLAFASLPSFHHPSSRTRLMPAISPEFPINSTTHIFSHPVLCPCPRRVRQFPTDDFDVTDLKYWFRHSSASSVENSLDDPASGNGTYANGGDMVRSGITARICVHRTVPLGFVRSGKGASICGFADRASRSLQGAWQRHGLLSGTADLMWLRAPTLSTQVLGHEIALQKIVSRFAAPHEIDKDPEFEECEMPVVIYSGWTMNVGETMALIPPMVYNLHSHGAFRNRNVRFAIPTPQKLPLESFNEWTIQPYSDHKPVTFAELSALRYANGSSHEACYRKVVLLKGECTQPLAEQRWRSAPALATIVESAHPIPMLASQPASPCLSSSAISV